MIVVVVVLACASPVDKLAIILATAAANASLWTPSGTSTDLFFLWSAGAYISRLPCSFKLLRDGPNSGGSSNHPIVTTNNIDISQPFVDCFIDGVRVRALLDTGSMKSFISQNVQRVIDFNNSLLDTSCAQTCVSITGDKLHNYTWTT